MKNKDIKRGRYSLVFTDSMQKHFISIACDINTGEIKEPQKKIKKLDLPIIDEYILTHFKDEKELKSYLNSLGYKIPEGYKPRIAYQSNHQLKFLEVIYQNHELYFGKEYHSRCLKLWLQNHLHLYDLQNYCRILENVHFLKLFLQ